MTAVTSSFIFQSNRDCANSFSKNNYLRMNLVLIAHIKFLSFSLDHLHFIKIRKIIKANAYLISIGKCLSM